MLVQEFLCTKLSCDILIGLIEARAAHIHPLLRSPEESQGETSRQRGKTGKEMGWERRGRAIRRLITVGNVGSRSKEMMKDSVEEASEHQQRRL